MPHCTLLVVLLLSAAPADPAEQPSPEENILQKAGVATDGDGLLAFFRGRTLSDAERKQVGDLIRRLGGDDFDDRERALEALKKFGGRAAPLVRAAAHDSDVEVARRAQRFLKEVEPPAPLPAVAAARLLARRAPADAVPVLLAYLPFAADEAVEDEVRAALAALTPDGKADPVLAMALDDARPEERAAAAYVLARKGDKEQRAAVRKRLTDADARVRWQAATGLLAAKDPTGVPCLADLLADGPFDLACRAEEVLRRLAGDKVPAVWLDDSPEGRRKARDAWAAWWKEKGDGFDVSQYKEPERPLGYTLGVEYNTGRVWECDLDGTLRWEIRDLAGPMDAQVLPNGHVLIAEADAHRVTERDLKGAVVWEQKIENDSKKKTPGEPNSCQRLSNGNTFVATPECAMEFTPDGKTAYFFKFGGSGSGLTNAARKGSSGHICHVWGNTLCRIESPEKWNGPPSTALPGNRREVRYAGLADLPGERFLVADTKNGRVVEVDAHGNVVWEADVPAACGVQRLRDGHTLVSTNHKVVELNAYGHEVWAKDAEGYVRRAYRR